MVSPLQRAPSSYLCAMVVCLTLLHRKCRIIPPPMPPQGFFSLSLYVNSTVFCFFVDILVTTCWQRFPHDARTWYRLMSRAAVFIVLKNCFCAFKFKYLGSCCTCAHGHNIMRALIHARRREKLICTTFSGGGGIDCCFVFLLHRPKAKGYACTDRGRCPCWRAMEGKKKTPKHLPETRKMIDVRTSTVASDNATPKTRSKNAWQSKDCSWFVLLRSSTHPTGIEIHPESRGMPSSNSNQDASKTRKDAVPISCVIFYNHYTTCLISTTVMIGR